MYKWGYIFIFLCFSVQALVPQKNSLKDSYKSVMHDLSLIKKCYVSKVPCNDQERKKAWQALKNSGITIGGLIAIVISGKWLWGKYHHTKQEISHGKKGNVQPMSERPLPAKAATKTENQEIEDFVRNTFFKQFSFVTIEVKDTTLRLLAKHTIYADIGNILRTVNAKYPKIKKVEQLKGEKDSIEIMNKIEMPGQSPGITSAEIGQPKKQEPSKYEQIVDFIQNKINDRAAQIDIKDLYGGIIAMQMPIVHSFKDASQHQQLINDVHQKYPEIDKLRVTFYNGRQWVTKDYSAR